jgi:hypothetical protein
MQNQSQITKRAPRQITRLMKTSGALRAGTLGDIQSPPREPDFYFKKLGKTHEHKWLFGTANAVCCLCGKTIPKAHANPPNEKAQ